MDVDRPSAPGAASASSSRALPRAAGAPPGAAAAPAVDDGTPGVLACVVLAHTDPVQVRRLIAALDPFPVLLHCDARTPAPVFAAMVADLPERVQVLPRRATGWASWGVVAAELDGYRQALATTDASHVALFSGADYPLAPTARIAAELADRPATSVAWSYPLPVASWGRGGYWRLRYRFRPWRKHMLMLPVPRRAPRGVVLAGGSQGKVLARRDAAAVLRVVDERPDLVRRWRSTWVPDETFVPSVLHTPDLVPGWEQRRVQAMPWAIGWSDGTKSPPWLTRADLPLLAAAREGAPGGFPALFARKFSTAVDTGVLDDIDATFRTTAARSRP